MTFVITSNKIEGFHRWPGAPEKVNFLRDRHRHIFHIRCMFKVSHDDRDIEIFLKQWEIGAYLEKKYGAPCEFDYMSCEMIARELMNEFNAMEVEVLEDGEGGARVRK